MRHVKPGLWVIMILASIIVLLPDEHEGAFWGASAFETVFFSITLIAGAIQVAFRWRSWNRRTPWVRIKHLKNKWGENYAGWSSPDVIWLAAEFEMRPREPGQATYVQALIGGRVCNGEPSNFILEKQERRMVYFPVLRDAAHEENSGYLEMDFGGIRSRSDVFQVSPIQ
mgnify:CR=1 FL=1